jgi:hypothetical protein
VTVEKLFVCFSYDAVDIQEADVQRIMVQIREFIVPVPDHVYVAVGPTADDLRDFIGGWVGQA